MPELSLVETILGALAALGTGGTATVLVRRPARGTPADHEERLMQMENRMSRIEQDLTDVFARHEAATSRFTDSTERLWRCAEKMEASIDKMRDTMMGLAVDAAKARALRMRREEEE
jgi:hypothetical protein